MSIMALLVAGAVAAVPVKSEPQRCLLIVDGKTFVRGKCLVFPMGDGSFTLNATEGSKRPQHFAVVNVTDGGHGDASWNEKAGDLHAWDALGPVVRRGAYWINTRARVCAWKL